MKKKIFEEWILRVNLKSTLPKSESLNIRVNLKKKIFEEWIPKNITGTFITLKPFLRIFNQLKKVYFYKTNIVKLGIEVNWVNESRFSILSVIFLWLT